MAFHILQKVDFNTSGSAAETRPTVQGVRVGGKDAQEPAALPPLTGGRTTRLRLGLCTSDAYRGGSVSRSIYEEEEKPPSQKES